VADSTSGVVGSAVVETEADEQGEQLEKMQLLQVCVYVLPAPFSDESGRTRRKRLQFGFPPRLFADAEDHRADASAPFHVFSSVLLRC
jgi:hypothetical protein